MRFLVRAENNADHLLFSALKFSTKQPHYHSYSMYQIHPLTCWVQTRCNMHFGLWTMESRRRLVSCGTVYNQSNVWANLQWLIRLPSDVRFLSRSRSWRSDMIGVSLVWVAGSSRDLPAPCELTCLATCPGQVKVRTPSSSLNTLVLSKKKKIKICSKRYFNWEIAWNFS